MRFNVSGKHLLLRHPLSGFGKIALWVGIFLLTLATVLAVIFGAVAENREAMWVVLGVTGLQGLVWGSIGVVFTSISGSGVRRLNDLKLNGQRFDAEIINLSPVACVNVNFHFPMVYAECIYINDLQQRCKVKSTMFLWENLSHEKLVAAVYADMYDPRRYAVEITRRETGEAQVDIDYTV